jgi:hypothetical protein
MESVPPDVRAFLLPAGTKALEVAVDQPQYEPMIVLRTPDGRVVMQWLPSRMDLLQLEAGQPLTLVLLTGGQRQQPVQIFVGGADLREEPTCPRCDRALSLETHHTRSYCVFDRPQGRVRVYDTYCELLWTWALYREDRP